MRGDLPERNRHVAEDDGTEATTTFVFARSERLRYAAGDTMLPKRCGNWRS